MYFLLPFLGLSILGKVYGEYISVDIEKVQVLYNVSDKYLSFSVNPSFLNENDAFNSDCLCMEKFLFPSYMRISVGAEEVEGEQLHRVLRWVRGSGFTPFLVLGASTQAAGAMAEAESLGLEDCVWQIGEGCFNETSSQYLSELETFRLLMTVMKEEGRGSWGLVSGAEHLAPCLQTNNSELFLEKGLLEALTFDSTHDFDSMDLIDETTKGPVSAYMRGKGVQLWKVAAGSKAEVDEVEKAFSWLQTLGENARSGYSVVFKEMEKNELKIPTMSYYVSLLHKILVGQGVLEVSRGSQQVPVFGHCAKLPSGPLSGAVTLFAANSGQEPSNIHVQIANKPTGGEVVQFILQQNSNGEIIINGKQKLEEEYLMPLVTEMKQFNSLYVSLPPKSVGFWVITNTDVEACYFDENSAEGDEEHIFTVNRVRRQIEAQDEDNKLEMIPSDKTLEEDMTTVFIKNQPEFMHHNDHIDQFSVNPVFENHFGDITLPPNPSDINEFNAMGDGSDTNEFSEMDVDSDNTNDRQFTHKITESQNLDKFKEQNMFLESSIISKNLGFEPVNFVTENIDIDKHFVDIPAEMGLKDLEADEIKTHVSTRSSDMNNMEDLLTLISQLSSLMELQEEFLGVESSILQPLSEAGRISHIVQEGVETLKRVTRGGLSDNKVNGLIVFKRLDINEHEELTYERIKDLFFSEDLRSKPVVKVVRDPKANLAMISLDLNNLPVMQPNFPVKSSEIVTNLQTVRPKVFPELVGNPREDVKSSTFDLPKMRDASLSKLSDSIMSQSLPTLDDLVGRAKDLLKEVNPDDEDNAVEESRTGEDIVGTPLGLLPLGVATNNLKLKASLAKTRLRMQELRHKVQGRLANLKVKSLVDRDLQKHGLVKRSLKDESIEIITKKQKKQDKEALKKLKKITKNKRKHGFESLRKPTKKECAKHFAGQNNEFQVDLTKPGSDLTVEHNRVRRFIETEDYVKDNEISNELDETEVHYHFSNGEKNEINTDQVTESQIKNELETKSTGEIHISISDQSTTIIPLQEEHKYNILDVQNAINSASKVAKVAKNAMINLDDKIHKILLEDRSQEGSNNNCGSTNLQSKLEGLRKVKKPSAEEWKSEDNMLDSVIERFSSIFEGVYGKVKNLYGKSGNR